MSFAALPRLPSPSIPAGTLSDAEGPFSWPSVEHVHCGLISAGIEKGLNINFLTPTLSHNHIELLATEALFSLIGEDRCSVFVMSANTGIRERFSQLRPAGKAAYSSHRWPVANVGHDGELTMKSHNWKHRDHFPGFIFRRSSTQLPNPDIAEKIGCVIYDDSVKYTDERWARFRKWCKIHNIPMVVTCLSDPLSPLVERLMGGVKWAWSPRHLDAVHRQESPTESNPACRPGPYTEHTNKLLDQRLSGTEYGVTVCRGNAGEQLDNVWGSIVSFSDLADELDTYELRGAVGRLKSTVGVLSRVVTDLSVVEEYYMDHPKHISIRSRLDGLEGYTDTLSSDKKSAGTTGEYRQVVAELTELYEDWEDTSIDDRKQGALLSRLHAAVTNDNSVHVVVPDSVSVEALRSDLEVNRPNFADRVDSVMEIYSADGLAAAPTCDELVFYGPPKYSQRWLLRAPHAHNVRILAYPHELGLLSAQVRTLNERLSEWCDREGTAALFDVDHVDEDLPASERIEIDIPNKVSESDDQEEKYEFDTGDATDTETILDDYRDSFDWTSSEAAANLSNASSSSSGVDTMRTRQHQTVSGCFDIQFADGEAIYYAPSSKVHVVDDDRQAVKKPVSAITPGDVVISLKNRGIIREKVREMLIDRGDIELVYHAELWRNELQRAIAASNDSFEDFKQKCKDAGISRNESTLEDWFNNGVHYTRYKEDMLKLTEAYEMEDTRDNFEHVWEATQIMKNVGTQLMKELRRRAYLSGLDGEVSLSSTHDIRLSDFSLTDEDGEKVVKSHEVSGVKSGLEVPRYQIGTRRQLDND